MVSPVNILICSRRKPSPSGVTKILSIYFIHKLLVDDALRWHPVWHHAAPGEWFRCACGTRPWIAAVVPSRRFCVRLVDLSLAITVHREEVLVGKLACGIEAQQLAFLFLGKFDLLAEHIDLLGGLSAVLQGLYISMYSSIKAFAEASVS